MKGVQYCSFHKQKHLSIVMVKEELADKDHMSDEELGSVLLFPICRNSIVLWIV